MRTPRTKYKNIQEVEDRFWNYVEICKHGKSCHDCCWLWMGEIQGSPAYGIFYLNGKQIGAHRISCMLKSGSLVLSSRSFHTCHRCDNPLCVSPYHLFIGSVSDNMKGAYAKKRIRDKHDAIIRRNQHGLIPNN